MASSTDIGLSSAADVNPYDDPLWVEKLKVEGRGFNFPQAHWGDLNNEVHPIFQTLIDQPGFMPALRLASKHLEEPLLLPFWHALFHGTPQLLPQESAAFETPVHGLSRKTSPLNAEEISQTKRGLLDIAPHIQFFFTEDADPNSNNYAITDRIHPQDTALNHLNQNAPANGSIIILDLAFAIALSDHSPHKTETKLRTSVLLARTLLHELAHAVMHYRFPQTIEISGADTTLEFFFEDQYFVELGVALETCLFGGTTVILHQGEDFNSKFGLAIRKEPSLADWNEAFETTLPKGKVNLVRKPPQRRWWTNYVLPMELIQKMFLTEFWNTQVKAGPKALQISKAPGGDFLGVRKQNNGWSPRSEDNWSDNSSLARWADDDGFVRPDQTFNPNDRNFRRLTIKPRKCVGSGFQMGEVLSPLSPQAEQSIRYFDENGKQTNTSVDMTATYAQDPDVAKNCRVAVPPVFVNMVHWIDTSRTRVFNLDYRFHG